MVGWHHPLNGHELAQTLVDGGGQGSLACCGPWGRRVGQHLETEQEQQERSSDKDQTSRVRGRKQQRAVCFSL